APVEAERQRDLVAVGAGVLHGLRPLPRLLVDARPDQPRLLGAAPVLVTRNPFEIARAVVLLVVVDVLDLPVVPAAPDGSGRLPVEGQRNELVDCVVFFLPSDTQGNEDVPLVVGPRSHGFPFETNRPRSLLPHPIYGPHIPEARRLVDPRIPRYGLPDFVFQVVARL